MNMDRQRIAMMQKRIKSMHYSGTLDVYFLEDCLNVLIEEMLGMDDDIWELKKRNGSY